jgi:hypothetical protein
MKKFLTATHWQLFSVLVIFPIVFQIFFLAITFIVSPPVIIYLSISIFLFVYLFLVLAWFFTLGTSLHSKLPQEANMNLVRFKIFLFIPVAYVLLIVLFAAQQSMPNNLNPHMPIGTFAVFVPLHLFSIFCMLYCLYFISKALKIVELQKPVTSFNDFAGEFFLLWFFPIGIWYLQPRINKLFDATVANDIEIAQS